MIELEYQGYTIYKPNSSLLYSIRLDGKGGSVPDVLQSSYTGPTIAKMAIDMYLDQKADKKDGTVTTRGK